MTKPQRDSLDYLLQHDVIEEELPRIGKEQPIIEIALGEDPITLSVVGSYDSYLWSSGEITSSIAIDSPSEQWYWVTDRDNLKPLWDTHGTLAPNIAQQAPTTPIKAAVPKAPVLGWLPCCRVLSVIDACCCN